LGEGHPAEPWMGRSERIEALVDPHLASPVVEII
jgi:hypothetical protein